MNVKVEVTKPGTLPMLSPSLSPFDGSNLYFASS